MSWRPNQQSKPWPWPHAVYLDEGNGDLLPAWGNTAKQYENPDGQILDGTVYKTAFPVPGEHYIYKSKKKFKDKYAKNKAKFDKKAKLPPITEAMSEAGSKAGSTRSTHSWMIPRYNPDILSDVMASDDSDSEDDDYTSGRNERKYRKSGRQTSNQPPSLRNVDVIRNVQSKPESRGQVKNTNVEVWPPDKAKQSSETNKNYNGLHRSSMNGDAVLANQLMMNNGSVYKERHPLGMSPTAGEEFDRVKWTDSLSRQQSTESQGISRRQSTRRGRKQSANTCVATSIVIIIIICLIGAGIAAYLLLRDSSQEETTTSPPASNIRSLEYKLLLRLNKGSFSSQLDDNQNSAFSSLRTEICNFLSSVPMREYLNIYRCDVLAFRKGSILADTRLFFREDHITALKARNGDPTDTDIVEFVIEDINKEIVTPSSQTTDFVQKYNVSVDLHVAEPPTTLQPTTDSMTTSDTSTVAPSVAATSTVATSPTTEIAVVTLSTQTTNQGKPSESETTSGPTTTSVLPHEVTSSPGSSTTEQTIVSSTTTNNGTESSSTIPSQ